MRVVLAVLLLSVLSACSTPSAPKVRHAERAILLPNSDGPPALVVTRAGAERQLSNAYETIELVDGREVTAQTGADQVQQRYGALLSARPARPLTFVLFYNLKTTDVTSESRNMLAQVKHKVATFPGAEVTVTGHTDTSGTTEYNDALSLSRARSVRDVLVQLGIPAASIEMVGRGAREPIVKTGSGVREERNRRVEVKLR